MTVTVVVEPASTTTTFVENETRAVAPETAEGDVEGRTSVRNDCSHEIQRQSICHKGAPG